MSYGPNVTKLITRFMAREAVPPGGGLNGVLQFFTDDAARKRILANAEKSTIAAIQAVKSAPDNPYGNDDEIIAGEILKKLDQRQRKQI